MVIVKSAWHWRLVVALVLLVVACASVWWRVRTPFVPLARQTDEQWIVFAQMQPEPEPTPTSTWPKPLEI